MVTRIRAQLPSSIAALIVEGKVLALSVPISPGEKSSSSLSIFEIVVRLALQLIGNGIQNHLYAPPHIERNFPMPGQRAVNHENLRQARQRSNCFL